MASMQINNGPNTGNINFSRKSDQYTKGEIAVKGDKEQQARAKTLLSELKQKIGIQEFNKLSSLYTKLANILSKDKNATVDDILNTYNMLSHPNDNALIGPSGVEAIINDFILEVGTCATDYMNNNGITVETIQQILKKGLNGEKMMIPTSDMTIPTTSKLQEEPKENVTISQSDMLRTMELSSATIRYNFTINKK